MEIIKFLKKFIMSREVEVRCAGEIVQRINKDLVEEVQSCLEEKRMEMSNAIDESHRAIAEKSRYNIPVASDENVITEAKRRISTLKLIRECCERIINAKKSDNEKSSKNGVDDAILKLVELAREYPHFDELRNLGKHLEESKEQRWNLASVMVHVKMKFDEYRIIFQTLLFISEVCSYALNLTAENNIIILVPILVLSATSFLFVNIPLIQRCCRKRTGQVLSRFEWVESAFSEWVESSFSIFQLVADILKVAGHADSSSKVTETWVLVFAVIGYVFFLIKRDTNVDGGRSNRGGIRKWIRRMIKKIKKRN